MFINALTLPPPYPTARTLAEATHTTDGRQLVLSRYTQPEAAVKLLLAGIGKTLPEQPPPQIRGKKRV